MRVVGRFADEVVGIEFGDCGVEVFEFVHDDARDPLVGVDLDNVKGFDWNDSGLGLRSGPGRG